MKGDKEPYTRVGSFFLEHHMFAHMTLVNLAQPQIDFRTLTAHSLWGPILDEFPE